MFVCLWGSLGQFLVLSLYFSASGFLFFSMVSFSLWNFWFFSCFVFLILFSCLWVLLQLSEFFSIIILYSLPGNSQISISLGSVTRASLVFFSGAMFAWLFVIHETLHWCLCSWRSKYTFQSLQAGSGSSSPPAKSLGWGYCLQNHSWVGFVLGHVVCWWASSLCIRAGWVLSGSL